MSIQETNQNETSTDINTELQDGEVEVIGAFNGIEDDDDLTTEAKNKREAKRKKLVHAYTSNIKTKSQVQVQDWGTQTFSDKVGNEHSYDVMDCLADYYGFHDQPNEPQYTANATASKGGRPRLSDEVM